MKIELINVGRNNVNKTFEAKNDKEIFKEIKKHLMSDCIDLYKTDIPNRWEICVGMFRTVGECIIEE